MSEESEGVCNGITKVLTSYPLACQDKLKGPPRHKFFFKYTIFFVKTHHFTTKNTNKKL